MVSLLLEGKRSENVVTAFGNVYASVNMEKIIYYLLSLFLICRGRSSFIRKEKISMKHEVKHQELTDEQLTMVAGGSPLPGPGPVPGPGPSTDNSYSHVKQINKLGDVSIGQGNQNGPVTYPFS